MPVPRTIPPARWERPGRWWRWGIPAASLAWVVLLSVAVLFHTSGVWLLSEGWRVPLLVLAIAVAAAGLVCTRFAAARPTIGREERQRLLCLQREHVQSRQIERDLRSRREQRERPVNPTVAALSSSSAGAGELVHTAMVVPMIAMVWARAALDAGGWLAAAMVLIGLLVALSAAYWIRQARQVLREVGRPDVPALVPR